MSNKSILIAAAMISGVLFLAAPAQAASHLWRFNEIFSNADGTIQFIELKECCGAANETALGNKDISSAATGNSYVFPANLPCNNCTANKHLLLATQSFADLPGAPTPDYIIEPGLFSINGDTLTYWFYAAATWTYGAGQVPVDGVNSLNRDGTSGINSPTNFAGEEGSVVIQCAPGDITLDGVVDVSDLIAVIGGWGPNPGHPADTNGDDVVDVLDLVAVITSWGPCT